MARFKDTSPLKRLDPFMDSSSLLCKEFNIKLCFLTEEPNRHEFMSRLVLVLSSLNILVPSFPGLTPRAPQEPLKVPFNPLILRGRPKQSQRWMRKLVLIRLEAERSKAELLCGGWREALTQVSACVTTPAQMDLLRSITANESARLSALMPARVNSSTQMACSGSQKHTNVEG